MNRGFIGALCMGVVAAMLSACGTGATQSGTPRFIPQNHLLGIEAGRRSSWMAPGAAKGALLYVGGLTDVWVYAYPALTLVGTLTGFDQTSGLCSDKNGNVWITNADNTEGHGSIVEYAHGGTTPLQTLAPPGIAPQGCSVDPVSGDLAVAESYENSLLIFPKGSGTPVVYDDPSRIYYPFIGCTYDNDGNVYIASGESWYDAATLWLPKGGSAISFFPIYPKPFPHPHRGIQFDGTYLVTDGRNTKIFQSVLKGDHARKHAKIVLWDYDPEYFWIHGNRFIGTFTAGVAIWKYPAGGRAIKEFATGRDEGVTVSVAPSH